MDLEMVDRAYTRWAPVYDWTFGAALTLARKQVVTLVNQQGGDVLEVGVGTGLTLPLYARDVRVTGFDYSAAMLEKARARVTRHRLANVVALDQMDARAMTYGDARFDQVVAMHVLSVVPDPGQVLAEIARVLRPGGRLVIEGYISGDTGVFGLYERLAARHAHRFGWHFQLRRDLILATPGLKLVSERRLPPFGMMTLMVLQKLS